MEILSFDVVENIIETLYTSDNRKYSSTKACSLTRSKDSPLPQSGTPHKLQTLLSTTPAIGKHIRHLSYSTFNAEDLGDPALLTAAFQKITHLQSLDIRIMDMYLNLETSTVWNDRIRVVFLPLLQLDTLSDFQLYGARGFSIADVAACATLRSLEFGNLTFSPTPLSAVPLSPATLAFSNSFTCIISYMSTARCANGDHLIDFSAVSILSLMGQNREDIETSRRVLQMCAYIVELSVKTDLFEDFTTYEIENITAIRETKTLKRLHLVLMLIHPPFDDTMSSFLVALQNLAHKISRILRQRHHENGMEMDN
ncbi:hypothetical protein BDN70DRAFT_968985 [Pholiota conissans]|uniref:Uncharacterized protein n=1 Tax=Pholiota conissans TaxID=109636 RepID=A0A9P6CNA2_9AGAR|nr:hypothetical protein BDN70DRAFT_968985 [Pholiota conissans]